jgi:hypothetical protein
MIGPAIPSTMATAMPTIATPLHPGLASQPLLDVTDIRIKLIGYSIEIVITALPG